MPERWRRVAHPALTPLVLGRGVAVPEVARPDALRTFGNGLRRRSGLGIRNLVEVLVGAAPGFFAAAFHFVISSVDYDHNVGDMVWYPFFPATRVTDFVVVPVGASGSRCECTRARVVVVHRFGDELCGILVPYWPALQPRRGYARDRLGGAYGVSGAHSGAVLMPAALRRVLGFAHDHGASCSKAVDLRVEKTASAADIVAGVVLKRNSHLRPSDVHGPTASCLP